MTIFVTGGARLISMNFIHYYIKDHLDDGCVYRLNHENVGEAGFKPFPTWQDPVSRYLKGAK